MATSRELTRRARSNKAKGASFEAAIVNWFRGMGYRSDRLARRGTQDEGDVSVQVGDITFVIEAKNVKSITLADFIAQSEVESERYREARNLNGQNVFPLVVVKRRQKGVEESYVIQTLASHESFLRRVTGV